MEDLLAALDRLSDAVRVAHIAQEDLDIVLDRALFEPSQEPAKL